MTRRRARPMTQDSPRPTDRLHPEGEQEQLLASSAVMAAGTVVSRFSGYLRSLLLAAALGNLLHADLFTIGNTVPNMLYILLAGGIFNAVLVPQLVRAMSSDTDGGAAYTNRVVTLSALFLGAVTVVLVARRALGDGHLLVARLRRPPAGRAARVDRRLRAVLPAAGLLLRDVRAGRAGAQRAPAVRADDVGADRQQPGLDRRPGRLPPLLRTRRRVRPQLGLHLRSGRLARPRSDRRDRRPAAGAAALPAGGGRPLPAALRLPRHGPGPHPAAGRVDGADGRRQPGRVRRGGAAGVQRHGPGRRRGRRGRRRPATRSTRRPS